MTGWFLYVAQSNVISSTLWRRWFFDSTRASPSPNVALISTTEDQENKKRSDVTFQVTLAQARAKRGEICMRIISACKEPPYKVEESGYAGFIMPIEVHFKNKEEPKKVCFTYDLFLNLEGNPPVNHLRCEKLTFNNPTKDFLRKLLKAGGYAGKDGNKISKPHKVTKEHRERPRKDSESKTSSKDTEREQSKTSKDSSRKPVENKLPKEEKAPPKAAFKEPKLALKEVKLESMSPKGGPPPEAKSSVKRPANVDSPKPNTKKQKKSSSKGVKTFPATSPRTSSSSSYPEKKQPKEKVNVKAEKVKSENEVKEVKKSVEVEESNSEDEASSKSEGGKSAQSSASNSSSDSSSDSDFEPSQNHSQGPLHSMVKDLQSGESDDDDSSSGEEARAKTNPVNRDSRLSHSDSDSDSSEDSCQPSREPPLVPKAPPVSKISGRKSPEPCVKPEKILKKGTYDKAYTDELVELHRRLMALRERNVLQQIVNLIEETGHFNVTNTTFDFDLFSLDETTVRKLQSYLEAVAT
uniref:Protein ENL isoform X5 n=1 Tax=Geotrypetes seraphini TaxID=260995 RepID=A0A6P8S3K3_GEOSA|nr:protein ENL isoform X5 [Geotrypetes seraphini]